MEEPTLPLLLTEARACLEAVGQVGDSVDQALDYFADLTFEDTDHKWLYDDAQIPKAASMTAPSTKMLGIAPMGLADWFKPGSVRCDRIYTTSLGARCS